MTNELSVSSGFDYFIKREQILKFL